MAPLLLYCHYWNAQTIAKRAEQINSADAKSWRIGLGGELENWVGPSYVSDIKEKSC